MSSEEKCVVNDQFECSKTDNPEDCKPPCEWGVQVVVSQNLLLVYVPLRSLLINNAFEHDQCI